MFIHHTNIYELFANAISYSYTVFASSSTEVVSESLGDGVNVRKDLLAAEGGLLFRVGSRACAQVYLGCFGHFDSPLMY